MAGGLLATTGSSVAGGASKYPPIPAGPITFGVSTPLSGPSAPDGIFTKLGFNVALAYFNQEHPNGIDGHPVKIELLDDASDVTKAVQVANQIVSDKDAAVITASYNPAATQQQLAVWAKAKMPVVANLSLPPGSVAKLSGEYPYDFSPNPAGVQYATNAGKWIDSHGYTKVAMLSDGIPVDTESQNQIIQGIQSGKHPAKIVSKVTITAGAVDDSAAITKLKASGANLLVVTAGESYGPIWQGMLAADWSPTILSTAGAWYSGFTTMGSLVNNAVAYYYNCADSATETFSSVQNDLMAKYAAATSNLVTNYLTFIATDSAPMELLDYAITKYHSTAPAAIKAALEGIHKQSFLGLTYTFTPTNHYGLVGPLGSAVCHMGTPYAGGVGKVPVKA